MGSKWEILKQTKNKCQMKNQFFSVLVIFIFLNAVEWIVSPLPTTTTSIWWYLEMRPLEKKFTKGHDGGAFMMAFSSVQSLSCVQLFVTPWIAARQASLSITISRSSLRLTSIESVMPSSHLILCHPILLLAPIPPSIRVFSSESTLHMRWPKYWSFSFSIISPKNTQGWSPSEWTGWISLQSKGLSRVFSNTTVQKHQFFGAQPSSQSKSHTHTWLLEKP